MGNQGRWRRDIGMILMESRSLRVLKGGKWREGGGNGGFGEKCRGLFGSPVGSPFGSPLSVIFVCLNVMGVRGGGLSSGIIIVSKK